MVGAPDASGGIGSFAQSLQTILTSGISRAADGYLSKKFPVGGLSDGVAAVDARGGVKPAAAPGAGVSAGEALSAAFKSPVVLVGTIAVVVVLAVMVARKR